jgi:leucyl aminopeptidase
VEFSIKNGNPEKQRHDCIIVGVFEGGKLSEAAKSLDDASNKAISSILKNGDLEGKLATNLLLHAVAGVAASRILLVGLGKQAEFGEKQYRQAVRAAVKALPKGVANAGMFLAELTIKKSDIHSKVAQLVEVAMDATYQVNAVKQKKTEPLPIEKIAIFVERAA